MEALGKIALGAVVFLLSGFFTAGPTGNLGFGLVVASITTSMAVIVGNAAVTRGRQWTPWMIYAALLWPVALIHVLVIGKDEAALEKTALQTGALRKCPACAELIKAEASKCRFCGSAVEPVQAPAATPPAQDVVV
ncbi:MAG TPA: hypothetical protein VFE34_02325 [Dongiaceae bacterium]|nr:hypothetical protein [Dongiaceae bacterium]